MVFLMSSDQPRKARGVERKSVAAPGDVQVGPQQDQVEAVELARDRRPECRATSNGAPRAFIAFSNPDDIVLGPAKAQ